MKFAVIAFVMLCAGAAAFAEPTKTIRNSGPATNRINLVILGDGYRQQDLPQYTRDVDDLLRRLFNLSPYSDYATYFNIVRVDVKSVDKGASHPESGVMRNTALGASYNCESIQRLVCVDQGKVDAVIARTPPAKTHDFVMIIVNDAMYGGAGGGASTIASIDPNALDLVAHELGHTIGLLADEYDSEPPTCDLSESSAPNVTDDFRRPKWPLWIGASTQLPTTGTDAGVPGTYKGARYCRDMFRPTFDSKMRTLKKPFEQVNTEQLILRFYNFVHTIDSVTPPVDKMITASCGGPAAKLQVNTPQPVGRPLSVSWRIDGMVVGTSSPSLIVQTSGLSTGSHTVDVEVSDTTPAVRNDPSHGLTDRRQWNLTLKGRGRAGKPGGGC